MKYYKHKLEEEYYLVKDNIFFELKDAVYNSEKIRRVCLSMHINWDSFLTEFKEITEDKLPIGIRQHRELNYQGDSLNE